MSDYLYRYTAFLFFWYAKLSIHFELDYSSLFVNVVLVNRKNSHLLGFMTLFNSLGHQRRFRHRA